jgi:hypothetical protein
MVVVKKAASTTLKLWTINDNRAQEVTIWISKSGLTHFHYLIGCNDRPHRKHFESMMKIEPKYTTNGN